MVALARVNTADLKARLDCREIAERYGLRRASEGKYYRWGGEDHASIVINHDHWRDMARGEHGDAISLVQKITKCTFRQAVDELGGSTYNPITSVYRLPSPTVRKAHTVMATWQTAATTVLERAIVNLRSNQRVMNYLREVRGFNDDTIISAKLGYLPKWTKTAYVKDNGDLASVAPGIVIPTFIDGKLEALKVRTRTGPFADALSIPSEQWKNRETGEYYDAPKYSQLAGGNPSPLFGGDYLRADLPTFILEGEFDVLLARQEAGELANFVTVGSASNTLTDADRTRLEASPRIMLAPDNDEAGELAFKRLAELFPTAQRITPPAGKDVTDYKIVYGGDIRHWVLTELATSPALTLAALPDGARSVALHCKLEAAVTVYELAKADKLKTFSFNDLLAASMRLGMNGARSTIWRGLRDGTGVFFTSVSKSDSSNTPSSIDQTLVTDFETEQTTDQRYALNQLDQIVIALRARLHYRLIERLFPTRRAELPPIEAELITAAGHDNPTEAATKLQVIVDSLTTEAERIKVQRKIAYERRTLDRLLSMLTRHHVTPIRWVAGVDFAAQYYRAVHEADPKPRSENEIALIVGRGRQNLDRLLDRAGVESTQRSDEKIELDDLDKIEDTLKALYQRAEGNGQIKGVRSVDERGFGKSIPFSPDTVRTWAAAELGQGRTVEFAIKMCNEQKITRDIKPPCKLLVDSSDYDWPAAPYTPRQKPTERPSATPIIVVKVEPYTGEGYDPAYARATLIKIHARSWALSPNDPSYDAITTNDLIGLIVDEPYRDDLQIMEIVVPSTTSEDRAVELETSWGTRNLMEAPHVTETTPCDDIGFTETIATPCVPSDPMRATPSDYLEVDSPFAAWLIEKHGGTVAVAEHPGKVLLDAYHAMQSYLAQCDYFDGLTVAQRGQLLDYKHHLNKVA